MARWVRVDASPEDDVRVNLVFRAAKDPAIHKALSRLEHRGGQAQALRLLLQQAQASGQLDKVVDSLLAGRQASASRAEAPGPAPAPKPEAVSAEVIQRMQGQNRF